MQRTIFTFVASLPIKLALQSWTRTDVGVAIHMQDPWVMVPEKGNEKSGLAMSALVRAMERKKQAAIILFVPRVSETGGANAATCVGYPLLVSQSAYLFDLRTMCNEWKLFLAVIA